MIKTHQKGVTGLFQYQKNLKILLKGVIGLFIDGFISYYTVF